MLIYSHSFATSWRNKSTSIFCESQQRGRPLLALPNGLRADIEAAANAADRSMNSVFVQAVRQYLDGQNRQALPLGALANAGALLPPTASAQP